MAPTPPAGGGGGGRLVGSDPIWGGRNEGFCCISKRSASCSTAAGETRARTAFLLKEMESVAVEVQ